jgi:hypothetical protein
MEKREIKTGIIKREKGGKEEGNKLQRKNER